MILDTEWGFPVCQQNPLLFVQSHYAAGLGLIEAGRIRVREMITHRLVLVETGQCCLSLRGAAGDVAISPGLGIL